MRSTNGRSKLVNSRNLYPYSFRFSALALNLHSYSHAHSLFPFYRLKKEKSGLLGLSRIKVSIATYAAFSLGTSLIVKLTPIQSFSGTSKSS